MMQKLIEKIIVQQFLLLKLKKKTLSDLDKNVKF